MFRSNAKPSVGLLAVIVLLTTPHTVSAGVLDKGVQIAIRASAGYMGWSIEETAARLATDPKARQVIVGTIRMLGLGKDTPQLFASELSPALTRDLQAYSGRLILGRNQLTLSDALQASQQRFGAPIADWRLSEASKASLTLLRHNGFVKMDELKSLYATRPIITPNPGLSGHLAQPIDGTASGGDAATATNPFINSWKKPTLGGASGLGTLCLYSQDVCLDWAKRSK